jgi:hypothetical protein
MTLGFENFKDSDSGLGDADSKNRLWLQSRTSLKFYLLCDVIQHASYDS